MKPTVLVLGSGPIRIGQGIEFDYSCVHCVWALRALGYRAIIINNNPETVSTDFDTGDGLYFEPVTLEDVLDVIAHENPIGVVCQFGGQTAINLAEGLQANGITVLGTSPEAIAMAEDRRQFDDLLESLNIDRPKGRAVNSFSEAQEIAELVGYPVLVRPSFVLGGRAMEIVFSPDQLQRFYQEAEKENPGMPVLVDKYLVGKEAEVDVICDGEDTLTPGIMEHIERAGVHSGDSMAVYPPVSLSLNVQQQLVERAAKIAKALGVRGLMNIQYVVSPDDQVYVLEVNPRASRTVPFLSKVTGVPMVDLATRCMMGHKLKDLGYSSGLWNPLGFEKGEVLSSEEILLKPVKPPFFAVKAPVFSFQKLGKVEPSLGPEMKSTGEIMGIDPTYEGALYKAMIASGIIFKGNGSVLVTVREEDKGLAAEIGKRLAAHNRSILATPGTAAMLKSHGVDCESVNKIQQGSPNVLDAIMSGRVSLMINTPALTETSESEAALIRRACIETGVPCVTSIDTAVALVRALEIFSDPSKASCFRLQEYFVQK